MPRPLRITLIAAAVPVILWGWLGVVFAMDRASDGGEVLGRVAIGEAELGGLGVDEALAAVKSIEAELGSEPIEVEIEGTAFTLVPAQVGFDLDEEALVDAALEHGRNGGFFSEMRWWLGNLTGGAERRLQVEGTYNREALISLLKLWEDAAIPDPPREGGITVQGGVIVPVYPASGTGLDLEGTADLIEAEILGDRRPVTALTEFRVPVLSEDEINHTVDRANLLVGDPITLAKILPEISLTIPSEVLIQSIASRVVGPNDNPDVELFFQIGPLVQYLNPIREEIETDPIDAQVVIRIDDVPIILPGSNGVKVDDGLLPAAVLKAASSVTRTAPLPVRDGDPPDFTTEDAESLGINELLYTATTFYSCCGDWKNQNRIINIHRIADETNGAIVMPGETFSLNEHVGKRTLEDGYRQAGAIIGAIVYCCDHPANVGGGVSQFATTLYNAIFWSGLQDVAHKPHTLYFPRYPLVREATLGFPDPDVVFKNDSPNAIYIKTEYTDSSVTVKFFGDTEGIVVEAETSERYNFVDQGEYFEPDPEVMPGEQELRDEGQPGFTAHVTRTITFPDGTKKSQTWKWIYDPFPIRYAIHPCELPPEHPQHSDDPCPVQLPNLGNMAAGDAQALIEGMGLVYEEGQPFIVTNDAHVGTVRAQTPAPNAWVEVGSTVTVRIGEKES